MHRHVFILLFMIGGCGTSPTVPASESKGSPSSMTVESAPIAHSEGGQHATPDNQVSDASISTDCANTAECTTHGRCVRQGTRCVAKTGAHCQSASELCGVRGQCSWCGDRCCAREATDCQGSSGCTDAGQCRPHLGHCMASPEGCRASRACATEGRCVPHVSGTSCTVGSQSDCQESAACTQENRCHLSPPNPETETRACVRIAPPSIGTP